MPKVSVIVPVYGVEAYIEKCATSLFEQTLDDIEFIFIDDCTPDNSMGVLENVLSRYPHRRSQVRIKKMETNSGQAAVRFHGINSATGEYIANCDSDDWVEPSMYEDLYKVASVRDADIVICDYFRSSNGQDISCKAYTPVDNKDDIYKGFFTQKFPWCVWNKLIKRDLFNKEFSFPKHTHGEDMAIILQLLYYVNKIEYIDKAYYHYRVASNTITHSEDISSVLNRFDAAVSNASLVERFYKDRIVNNTILNGIVHMKWTQRNKLISLIYKEDIYYDKWINTFPEINSKILSNPFISLKQKIKFVLAKYRIVSFSK